MFAVKIKTQGFESLLENVAKLSRVEIKKAVADSGGRIGVDLAKRTFPMKEEQGRGKIGRQLGGIYPKQKTLYKQIEAKSAQAAVGFSKLLNQRRFDEAQSIAQKVGLPWTIQSKPTKETHRGRLHYGSGGVSVIFKPDAIWLTNGPSFESYSRKLGNRVGTAANGWVMASRDIRKARTSDAIPQFKRKKRPMRTGSGRMSGTPQRPLAILRNEVDYISNIMPSQAVFYALERERGNLELQVKNLLKNVGRRARK